ncbi:hypothetical protein MKX03_036762 [Papaver bracteatum]|nr:hypothetical protein MKX03_036762 [Papaver bracteatum]
MKEGDDRKRRMVVSICGMGGIGKTTLAKKVYASSDVRKYFNSLAFVSISMEYRMSAVKSNLIYALTQQHDKTYLDALSDQQSTDLRSLLQGNKYLIVLDDVWETLGNILPSESNGSRILMTTRNKEIAIHADGSSINFHELCFRNKTESWDIFVNRTFLMGDGLEGSSTGTSRCPSDLEPLGKEMVKRCQGLPLAIIVLGGLLSCKPKTLDTWSKVEKNFTWELNQGPSSHLCHSVLALSYYSLPFYLKPCFLYIGMFPEDTDMKASTLYRLWIAEGFIKSRGGLSMEEMAEEYLEELIHRRLIQVERMTLHGKVHTCRVHDLLRDICQMEAKQDHFYQVLTNVDNFPESSSLRRVIIRGSNSVIDANNELEQYMDQFHNLSCVRSFIYTDIRTCPGSCKIFWKSLCENFRLLKVLHLKSSSANSPFTVSRQIGELLSLKYLKLDGFHMKEVSFLESLIELQSLDLTGCSHNGLYYIWGLVKIRHLHVSRLAIPSSLWNRIVGDNGQLSIGNLRDLRTLDALPGEWLYHCGGWNTLRMLRKIRLRGYFPYRSEFLVSIMGLTTIQSLQLLVRGEFPGGKLLNYNVRKLKLGGTLPANFGFPANLIKLTLIDSEWSCRQVINVIGELRNLRSLTLQSCGGGKLTFPRGKFLQLQVLNLISMNQLRKIVVQEGALLNLTHLHVRSCLIMESVPEGLHQIRVQELKVADMPTIFTERLVQNQGEDWEIIKNIPSVKIITTQ